MKIIHTFTAVRIYLVGYMASGKSNLGKVLAGKLAYNFVDLDYLFEERFRIGILDFFGKYGEKEFRRIERSLLVESTGWEDTVIATGGGTPCFFDNMEVIRQAGLSIYLHWDPEPLVERLRQVKRKRPLLKDIPDEELPARVGEQLKEREVYYTLADFTVNGEDPDIDSILGRIRCGKKEN